jgi:hypothetical protein
VAVELFAGVSVSDFRRSLAWYGQLLGSELRPAHAGHALHTLFVDDLDERVRGIADRGIEPAQRETYGNGVRKVTYRDPDGNEFGFGGGPVEDT